MLTSYMVIVCVVFTICVNVALCSSTKVDLRSTVSPLNSKVRNQISILRHKGEQCSNNRQFNDAIKCYTAALQLVEGIPGDEAYELRRRLGLSLAYYNLKHGDYAEAVARCSEVIDESSNFISESGDVPNLSEQDSEMLQQALSTAHKRRGKALELLGKDSLAAIDFAFVKLYKSKNRHFRKSGLLKKYSKRIHDLQDFVEECQSLYPRENVSSKEVLLLTSNKSNQMGRGFPHTDAAKSSSLGIDFPLGNNLDMGSLFGDFGKDMKLSQIVRQFGPLLGLGDKLISTLVNILDFYEKINHVIKKFYSFVSSNKEALVAGATIVLTFFFFRQQFAVEVFLRRLLNAVFNIF